MFRKLPQGNGPTAYGAALSLLSRRELSAAQVRERLLRRGYDEQSVNGAIERLIAERAIDDARVAEAIVHTELSVKRHGRLRVRRQLRQAGIDDETARNAVSETFAAVDDDALLAQALGRRLRDDRPIQDEREFQRLYRFLSAQGFESDRILRALEARRRPR